MLAAGDPAREVWFAWNAKEVVRQIYDHTNPDLAVAWVAEIGRDFTDESMPFGFRRFEHYRIRALLHTGRPNWSLLNQLTPP